MRRSAVCARCGEVAAIRTDDEHRRAGWTLADLTSHSAMAGGYTLLCWLCGGCSAEGSKRSLKAS